MNAETPAYGLWVLVIINTAVFIIFAFSFARPRTGRDWRSFGAFSAFLVALFTEMYGFPLTLYLLSGWLGSRYPGINLLAHDSGHLWSTLLGWQGDAHFSPLHLLSYLFIGGGFALLSAAWNVLYQAQREHQLAHHRPLRLPAPPAIRGVYPYSAWFLVAVANLAHAADVPDFGFDVRTAGAARGTRGAGGIWRRLCQLCRRCAWLLSSRKVSPRKEINHDC